MNLKGNKFTDFLEKAKIECFKKEEIKNEEKTAIFRSVMEVAGQELPIIVVLDNSIYANIRVQISSKTVKEHNMNKILLYINELNRQHKVFKYYITEEGDLCLDCCIVSIAEEFNSEIVCTIINVMLKSLEENYPVFMKMIWNEEK